MWPCSECHRPMRHMRHAQSPAQSPATPTATCSRSPERQSALELSRCPSSQYQHSFIHKQACRPWYVKSKVKRTLVQALRLCTGRTAHRGSRGIALLFLNHGTRRGERSASLPGRSLPPGKTRYPLYRRLGGAQGLSGQVRKISPPPGFDPRTVQPVVSRYTHYATRPTTWYVGLAILMEGRQSQM